MLHKVTHGDGDAVVLLHGFTQSGTAWDPIATRLAERHTVVTLDAPGHGGSAGVRVDLADGADLMAAAAPARASWVGYSMGGRFALNVALRHPEAVNRLVLVGTTAGIDDPVERAARRESDEALAAEIETVGVRAFLDKWLAQPLFSTLPPADAAIESRLGSTPEGLASSLRLAGSGTQEPLWAELHRLEMPVLVVAGELDTKYSGLARRMVGAIGGNARLRVVAGAGHACHLERPAEFLDALVEFLDVAD